MTDYNRQTETAEHRFQRDMASYQHEQDFLKHLATLDTGSILLLVTFLEKLFKNPEWKFLVGVALISFATSLLGCLASQAMSVLAVDTPHSKRLTIAIGVPLVLATFGGFFTGIIALCAFALKNFY